MDLIIITTQDYSITKDLRKETDHRLHCSKKFDKKGEFCTTIENRKNIKNDKYVIKNIQTIYGLKIMKIMGIEYDTTDIARLTESGNNKKTIKKENLQF